MGLFSCVCLFTNTPPTHTMHTRLKRERKRREKEEEEREGKRKRVWKAQHRPKGALKELEERGKNTKLVYVCICVCICM